MAETPESKRDHSWKTNRHLIDGMWWGAVLVWCGIAFLADSVDYLPEIGRASEWSWVFVGAGFLALLSSLWRSTATDVLSPTAGDYIVAFVLLAIGIGGFTSIPIAWPAIIIVIGVVIIVSTITGPR